MSRAWLAHGRLHVQCDNCSSSGTPGGASIKQQVPEGLRKGYKEYGEKLSKAVATFQSKTAALRFDHNKTDDEKRAAYQALKSQLNLDMTALTQSWPGREGVQLLVEKCPWCSKPLNVVVEDEVKVAV